MVVVVNELSDIVLSDSEKFMYQKNLLSSEEVEKNVIKLLNPFHF